jgi:hypothetical protein
MGHLMGLLACFGGPDRRHEPLKQPRDSGAARANDAQNRPQPSEPREASDAELRLLRNGGLSVAAVPTTLSWAPDLAAWLRRPAGGDAGDHETLWELLEQWAMR